MVFTFYKARGLGVGSSLVEEDQLELAKKLETMAKEKGVKVGFNTHPQGAWVEGLGSRNEPTQGLGLRVWALARAKYMGCRRGPGREHASSGPSEATVCCALAVQCSE